MKEVEVIAKWTLTNICVQQNHVAYEYMVIAFAVVHKVAFKHVMWGSGQQ